MAIQICLSLVLLLGAALLSKSLYDLRTFDPGFRRDHLLVADIDTSQTLHKNAAVTQFFHRLIEQTRAIPGVRDASASVVVPLGGTSWQQDYEIPASAGLRPYHSFENWVTPSYFKTLGTPLLLGRHFDARDSAKGAHVALVNQAFAAQAFGSSNPIGRQIYEKGKKDRLTIIGVVADARYRTLRAAAPPTLYRPTVQIPPSYPFVLTLNLEVWTSSPAIDLRNPIRKLLRRLNSRATVDFRTFDSLIDSNLLYERLLTALSVAFGLIGLFLSALGVYGLSAYSVARRTSEFGIRMALGATPESIFKLVLSEQLRLLAIALPAGLLISVALAQFLRAWLFGVSATDPALYAVALFFVGAIALLAAFLPARRASRLNPSAALRCE